MSNLDRQREQLAARAAMIALYRGPVLSFEVRPPFYLASCDACGWVGSSEACGTDGDDDVFCPRCHTSGADCGRVAALIAEPVAAAAANLAKELEEAEAVAWMLEAHRVGDAGNAKPMCGKVFMTKAIAEAAAKRLSMRWRVVRPFPVYAMKPEGK